VPVIVDTANSANDCLSLGFDHGLKLSGNGQATDGAVTVTASGYNSPTGFVDWSSTAPITAVYVKGGPSGGNLFSYPTGDTGDQDLHTPQKADGSYYSVSHLAFCWDDVPAAPDVVVEKSNDPTGVVEAGGTISYTLTVTNDGDGNATGVALTDELPTGVTFVDATPGCSEDAGTVTCVLGDVDAGASLDVEITVSVDAETCGALTNVAAVEAANETGGATGNNVSNEVANTVGCDEPSPPDLEVTKSSSAAGILGDGDQVTYTLQVTNTGDVEATGVQVHDLLPAGVDVLLSTVPTFKGTPCTIASSVVPGQPPVTTVECGPASLAAGESATITVLVEVNGDVCGAVTNAVDVEGANEPEANVGPENHAEVDEEIECVPNIRLVKGGTSPVHVGDTVTYTFSVRNNGGVDLTDVELVDLKCDTAPTLVDDGDGDTTLAVGEEWSYECDHVVVAGDGDPVHNEATVTGAHDGGEVSDTDAFDVQVLHPAIALDKTASPTSGPAGTVIVYTYAVTNTGDTKLFNLSVDDDVLGHIGTIASLDVGATAELTASMTLADSPVTNVAVVEGSDVLGGPGGTVSAQDTATVTVVSAGGGGTDDGTGGSGGSPFTGSDVGPLAALVLLLAAIGAALVASSQGRSTGTR
jgi:uncharacterized repeat protein (TIGR01451 family)